MATSKKNKNSFFQAKNEKPTLPAKADYDTTVIGKGLSIEGGTIKGDGNVRIDGYFVGDIEISGDVTIGGDGAVYGNIQANSASISGNSKGLIKTATKTHLTATAVVEGAITSNVIEIDEHAVFNGSCEMETNVQLPDTAVKATAKA